MLFSYRYLPNFYKLRDSDKPWIIFSERLDYFQFLNINSLKAENFSKQNFNKQIAKFDNN